MKYTKIVNLDSGNARGLSVVLFVNGCEHHCEGCHNPETWNEFNGKDFDDKAKAELIEYIKNPHISNLVLSGGDPLYCHNRSQILKLAKEVKEIRDINIIVYTGYTLEEINKILSYSPGWYNDFYKYIDVLIDGRFEKDKVTKKLDYRGSTNQNAYRLIEGGKAVLINNIYFKS